MVELLCVLLAGAAAYVLVPIFVVRHYLRSKKDEDVIVELKDEYKKILHGKSTKD